MIFFRKLPKTSRKSYSVTCCLHLHYTQMECKPRKKKTWHSFKIFLCLYIQPYEFPSGVSLRRYLLQYFSDAFPFIFPRITIVPGNVNEFTLSRLRFGSEYNITITPQVRFSQCRFNTLSGPESDEVSAITQESGIRYQV